MGGAYRLGADCAGDGDASGGDDFCEQLPPRRYGVRLFASAGELGLVDADDIDGLTVFDFNANGRFDENDRVLFSLTPGSPSLRSGRIAGVSESGAGADVFLVAPGALPTVLASAGQLGLGAAADNIDALDVVIGVGMVPDRSATEAVVRVAIRASSGDVNCDGEIDIEDAYPFVLALTDPAQYAKDYADCDRLTADCNGDGVVDMLDVGAFLTLLDRHRGNGLGTQASPPRASTRRTQPDRRPAAGERERVAK
jgi:hypothetical protein